MPRPPAAHRRGPEIFFLGIAVLAAVCWIVDRAVVEPTRSDAVQRTQDEYLRTKHGGSSGELCGQAGQVKQAYNEADDSADSESWKSVQQSDCAAAGEPQRERQP